jgi:hypothetical protein
MRVSALNRAAEFFLASMRNIAILRRGIGSNPMPAFATRLDDIPATAARSTQEEGTVDVDCC